MAFTDGAVGGGCSDTCSAASVMLPLEVHGSEIEKSEVLDKAADPVETEAIANALSLESAIEYCKEFQLCDNKPWEMVILSDSKGAIEAVTKSTELCCELVTICRIQIFITWIPAHIGIYYKEMVNKVATELKQNSPTDGTKWISLSACRSVLATQLKRVAAPVRHFSNR